MTQWLIGIFVRLIKLQRRPNDGNKVSFFYNLQQSPRLLKLCGGGKIEKVWGTFSNFLILGVLSHSLFIILF